MRMRDELEQKVGLRFSKGLLAATNQEIYQALLELTQEKLAAARPITGERKLYYISAEFLVGKLLSNNLINLGIYDEVKEALTEAGKDLSAVEEVENEPSLGNGGLGRLAACYLDSAATLGLPGDGVGLLYHFGLFHQYFEDHKQVERPDAWLSPKSWLQETGTRFTVPFPQGDVEGVLYDLYVSGYDNGVNKLHLFDLATVDEGLVKQGIDFDKTDIQHNLTLFLYPDDSDRAGRLLRVYQQYFMVSCAAQLILKEVEEKGWPLASLHEHAVIQINDTHPSMVIPELIRLLTARGLSMDEAIATVSKTCAYTNHTILAEALEKWPLDFLEEAVPGLVPVIQELDRRAHGPHGHPLRLLRQRGGQPPHGDFGEVRAEGLRRHLPGEVQQQDQRHHLPPVADALQPRPGRLYHGKDRPRLEKGRGRAGKAAPVPGRRGHPAPPAGHQAPEQKGPVRRAEGEGRGGDRYPLHL